MTMDYLLTRNLTYLFRNDFLGSSCNGDLFNNYRFLTLPVDLSRFSDEARFVKCTDIMC